jgi:CubicO group peptidase (beta-lactamase class C family)
MWQNPHYADGAYAIIGRALESVVGMSYEDYITQHIFKPLGRSPITAPAAAAIAHDVNQHIHRNGQLVLGLQLLVGHGQEGAAGQGGQHHLPVVCGARRPQLGARDWQRTSCAHLTTTAAPGPPPNRSPLLLWCCRCTPR